MRATAWRAIERAVDRGMTRTRCPSTPCRTAVAVAVSLAACLVMPAGVQAAGGLYSCTDSKGNKYSSDRPIPQCADREQQLLNRDGSVRGSVGPSMTAEERAAYEEAQRRKLAAEAAHKDVVRHDRNLMTRYPNEAAHVRARESAIDPARQALRSAEKRLADLGKERARLDAEAEFYTGKPMPRQLKLQFGQNQAAVQAQQHSIEQHRSEVARLQALYDEELARLKKLWSGAQPGAVGPIPTAALQPATGRASMLSPAASSAVR